MKQEKTTEYKLTDQGNAELFRERCSDKVRYCSEVKQWMIWNGKQWKVDSTNQVHNLAVEAIKGLYDEARNHKDLVRCKELSDWASKSLSSYRISSLLTMAEPLMPICMSDLDSHQWLLNVQNGVIDLRTGELLPHNKDLWLSNILPASYQPQSQCPQWLKFLNEIMGGNKELIKYLQKAIGYALTGSTSEQCMFILFGGGANGKSTFLKTVLYLLGDYGANMQADSLMAKKYEGIRNDIARLKGRRFVTSSEGKRGHVLDEALIKQITGGDPVTARFLRQENFEFMPEFKVYLATNYKPEIRGADHGIWRRLRLIPFSVRIAENRKDMELDKKLLGEIDGILNWAVEGCLLWQREGLCSPQIMEDAVKQYRSEMDVLTDFIDTCCVSSPGLRIKKTPFYEKYKVHCYEYGAKPLAVKALRSELLQRGFIEKTLNDGIYWLDIDVRTEKVKLRTE
ncbi:phage/plasmid primase, P4 family [Deltaproteobacteria bacterium IMCC39524]|nr:phage/plasmid primase, P4 family [Deltaproteobacteria bacterium IMCC39524]